MDQSYEVIQKLLMHMNMEDIPVYHGAYRKLVKEQDILVSEGIDLIIEEARKDSEEPLYVLCMSALTNVAMALNPGCGWSETRKVHDIKNAWHDGGYVQRGLDRGIRRSL